MGSLAKAGGFSLHAGVSAKSHQRAKVEKLCRYIARPAVSTQRMARLPDGRIRYELMPLPYASICQGRVRIIACIQDRAVINQILSHINRQREFVSADMPSLPSIRAPPCDSTLRMNLGR